MVTTVPPGPRGHFLLGSLPDMNRDLLGLYSNAVQTYGEVSALPFPGGVRLYVIGSPAGFKQVLQNNNRNYRKNAFLNSVLAPINGLNLFTADGESWLSRRRLMQPAFHRQRIAGFGPVITGCGADLIARWRTLPAGAWVDVVDEMMAVTLRIAGHALFGKELASGAGAELGQAFAVTSEYANYRFRTPFAPPLWVPTRMNRALKHALKVHDRLIYALIRERRPLPEQPHDLLGMMIDARDAETGAGMTDQELHNEISAMMFAGHETTAITLSWALYLLSQTPEALARLRAEVGALGHAPEMDDLPALAYTRRVIDETLRLYPPAWGIARESIGPDTIGGYPIPANASITLAAYAVHHDAHYWSNPERFDPDRFLPERADEQPAFAYIPFGGGPRLCIGNSFALTEATLLLAALAQAFDWRLKPGHPVKPKPIFTLHPSDGLPMQITPRT
jgi:cytochrome P450